MNRFLPLFLYHFPMTVLFAAHNLCTHLWLTTVFVISQIIGGFVFVPPVSSSLPDIKELICPLKTALFALLFIKIYLVVLFLGESESQNFTLVSGKDFPQDCRC